MAKPAARITDAHDCPMMAPIPHVGGVIMGPGQLTVLIGGKPAATELTVCECNEPLLPIPNAIAQGSPTVLIGGRPAARLFDETTHGGNITFGEGTVLIGDFAALGAATVFPGRQNFTNCGVQCVEQIIRQAKGTRRSEKAILAIANAAGHTRDSRGTTSGGDKINLLTSFGVEADQYFEVGTTDQDLPVSMDTIKTRLKDPLRKNKGIIARVNAGHLWNDPAHFESGGNHVVLITEGDFNEHGNLTHVYINDTGTGEQGRRVPINEILEAMYTRDPTGTPFYSVIVTRASIWNQGIRN